MPDRHVLIDGFLERDFAEDLLAELIAHRKNGRAAAPVRQQAPHSIGSPREIGPAFALLDELIRSPQFRELLLQITGIRDLRYVRHGQSIAELRRDDEPRSDDEPGSNNEPQPTRDRLGADRPPIDTQRRIDVTLVLERPAETSEQRAADHGPEADATRARKLFVNRCVIVENDGNRDHGVSRVLPRSSSEERGCEPITLHFRTPDRLPSASAATIHCPICDRDTSEPELLGIVACTHPGAFACREYRLVECRRCDAIRLDPLPTSEDLRILYEQSEQFSDAHYTDPAQIARVLGYFCESLERLGLLPRSGDSMLEVGAGLSWAARACKLRDRAILTIAQDVTSECARTCPWVDEYIVGTIDRVPERSAFALISMTHVIEHLTQPVAMLQSLARRLAPDGKIFVTAPYRPEGWRPGDGIAPWRSYSYLHVPAHISYLSRMWFELACESAGLRLLQWDQSHENGQAFEAVLARA